MPRLIARKRKLVSQGIDVINLAKGDPDKPTLARVVRAMHDAIDNPSSHAYPPYQGTKDFREAAARWMERRFKVEI